MVPGKAMPSNVENNGGARRRPWRMAPWALAAALLLLPLVAMQFSKDVNWTPADFMVMGVLLFGACGVFELAARKAGSIAYMGAAAVAIVAGLLLVWINLAVGIIGSENNPANLMFGGVLAVGLLGGAVARFRPAGMARALVATAIAQALVGALAQVGGLGSAEANWPGPLVLLTGFFAALWLLSAWLFGMAARTAAGRE